MPAAKDMKQIAFKAQRRKNLLPEHAVLTAAFNDTILAQRERVNAETDETKSKLLKEKLRATLAHKREHENELFEKLARDLRDYIVNQPSQIRLYKQRRGDDERLIMRFDRKRNITTLFDRYVALVLSRSYQVKLWGRDQLVRSLLNALRITSSGKVGSKAHRSIVRIDIKNFFDSIDHNILLKKLRMHSGVPLFALKHVESLLEAYSRVEGKPTGIPQGVPSSSVLAEIYLENLDYVFKQDSSVVFYGRYVDDIILVCQGHDAHRIYDLASKSLARLSLVFNDSKTSKHFYPTDRSGNFDYLGYSFGFDPKTGQLCELDLSSRKFQRYEAAFQNLKEYIQNITCWAKPKDIDLLLESVGYLFYPRVTIADADSLRIVTGLAYSARFIQHEGLKKRDFMSKLLHSSSNGLKNLLEWLRPLRLQLHPACPCCQQEIHRFQDLWALAENGIVHKDVLEIAAVPHADELTRREVKKLLWK